ncbi:MAG: TolC family protein [Polyangiaceae bacterium]|nr:TolC family protein [Polyangiaceae bacterium]
MLTPVVRLPVLAAVVSALFLFFPKAAHAQLSIEQALEESAKNNETTQIARLEEVAAEGELETARSDLYPTLVAGASGTLRAQEGPGGRHFTSQGTLTLTQPLFRPSAPGAPSTISKRQSTPRSRRGASSRSRRLARSSRCSRPSTCSTPRTGASTDRVPTSPTPKRASKRSSTAPTTSRAHASTSRAREER